MLHPATIILTLLTLGSILLVSGFVLQRMRKFTVAVTFWIAVSGLLLLTLGVWSAAYTALTASISYGG